MEGGWTSHVSDPHFTRLTRMSPSFFSLFLSVLIQSQAILFHKKQVAL